MPSECLYINPEEQNFRDRVDKLAPTPGYCVFVDIAGSTEMKQQGLRNWIAFIHNGFSNANLFLAPFAPLKGIGDELMYYIEDIDLQGNNALQIYDGLWQTATEQDSKFFKDVKIVAARCQEVYPITFIRGNRDYYGVDIDLTARLKDKAVAKQVVIDSRFHEEIIKCYTATGNKEQFESVRQLQGPEKVRFKGIPNEVTFYRGC